MSLKVKGQQEAKVKMLQSRTKFISVEMNTDLCVSLDV